MDIWPVNSPSTGSQHGGHTFLQLQQPKEGVSVGSGQFPQRPPFNVAPEFQQARGVPSVDSGLSGTQPLNKLPPGPAPGAASSPCHLSFDEMMTGCSQLMEQLINQQLQFQQALSATESAMAAAPSSFIIRPAQKKEQPVEVMSAARCDQGLFGLNQFSHPLGSTKVCHETAGSPLLPVHTVLTSSITTSQQIVSPAPSSQTRAPAASEDGLQSAGEKISDVTSDDHNPRKLVQVGNQLDQHREADEKNSSSQRFQLKHANPSSCQTIEAPASTTAQNDIPADVIDQHREQSSVWPASGVACGTVGKMFGWHEQNSSPNCKVEACANGSLQLFIASGRQRPNQGKFEAFVDQLQPWPPPTPAAHSSKLNFIKFRGGREDPQTFWILSLLKLTNQPNVFSSINPHLKHVNCSSNCDVRERPLHHSLRYQILVASASSLIGVIIPNMITSSVPELPPLIPMKLTPRSSTSEPAAQPATPLVCRLRPLRIAALTTCWLNIISNGYAVFVIVIYHNEHVGANLQSAAGFPASALRKDS